MAEDFVPSGVELIAKNLGGFLHDLTKADSAIAKVGSSSGGAIAGVTKGFSSLGSSIADIGVKAAQAAAVGIAALGAGLAAVVGTGVSKAMDLDQQMANIAATMNKTKNEVAPLKDLIFDLALDPNLKVTTTEAADAIEKLTKNGITMQEVLDGAGAATVALANATGAQFNTAAEVASGVMKNYKLEAKDLSVAIDGITGVTTNSKFTIDDYALAFAQSGAVAANLGVDIKDLNTVLAGTATAFSSGSDAGTSLKALLLRLSAPTEEAQAAMDKYGISLFDSNGKMRDMGEVVGQFNKVFQGTAEVTTTVGGATKEEAAAAERASKSIGGLTADIEHQQKKLQLLNDEQGAINFHYGEGSLRARNHQLSIDKLKQSIGENQAKLVEYQGAIALVDGAQERTVVSTQKLTEAERAKLAETIGGMDAARLLLDISNMTEDQFETLSDKVNDSGQAFRSAATRMDSAKGAMEIFWGIVDAVQIKIGEEFLPIIKDMTFAFIDWSEDAGPAVIDFFSQLADMVNIAINDIGRLAGRFQKFGAAGLFAGLGFEGTALFFKKLSELFTLLIGDSENLGETISGTIGATFTWLGQNVFPLLSQGVQFLIDNFTAFQGALAGIGAAAGIGLLVAGLTALLSPVMLIIGAAALLGAAWNTNFGGIRDATLEAWAVVQPALTELGTWLLENIPVAVQATSDFMSGTLFPTLGQVFGYIGANVIPAIVQLGTWLGTNLPIALQFLSDAWTGVLWPAITAVYNFVVGTWLPLQASWWSMILDFANNAIAPFAAAWTNILLPAITGIWSFVSGSLLPLWFAVNNFFVAVGKKALTAWAGLWQNVLLPALEGVWDFISANILPIFDQIGTVISDKTQPAVEGFSNMLPDFSAGMKVVNDLIKDAIGFFEALTGAVNDFDLPPWLKPGSPPPLAYALDDINTAAAGAAGGLAEFGQATIDALLGVRRDVVSVNGAIGAARDEVEDMLESYIDDDKAKRALKILGQVFRDNSAIILSATDRVAKFKELVGKVNFGVNAQQQHAIDSAFGLWISQFDKELDKMQIAQQKMFIEAGKTALTIGNRLNDIVSSSVEVLNARVATLKKLVASGAESVNFEGEIISAANAQELLNQALMEQRDIQDDILTLKQNEQKLGFLEKQLDLVQTLSEAGLNVDDILGGMTLGLDASIPDMIEATNRLVQAMIEQVNADLQLSSPSRVMFDKFELAGEGAELGILSKVPDIVGAFHKAMDVPTLGDVAFGMEAFGMDRPLPTGNTNVNVTLDIPELTARELVELHIPVQVNNKMDVAELRQIIRQEVRNLIGGA